MELTSELQGTHAGDYRSATSGDACLSKNYVNLRRLNAALPIVSPKSESPRTTGLTFEIASLSTCMTAQESIGGDLQTFSNLSLLAGYSHAFGADTECKDFIGLGAFYKIDKCHLEAFTDYANFRERDEFATELTWKVPVLQHLDLQPTVHLIAYNGKLQCAATLRLALCI